MTTWVFLRGLAREARHWGDFPARFRATCGGDILVPDLPGNGRLWAETSPTRVEDMVEACRHRLREQGKVPPYYLLGLSMGGMVAVAWARRHPEECLGVVLINTSLRPHGRLHERLHPGAMTALLRMSATGGVERERAILELTSARAAELRHVLTDWSDWARECPVSRGNALRQLFAAARFSAPEKPEAPLLILAGARDRMVHPACSRRLAHAWNTDFALHPTAGHDLPLDDGDWVANEVRNWLARRV